MSSMGLYVHMPWCVRKCPYCDFNSHGVGPDGAIPEQAYLQALMTDLEQALPSVWGRPVSSIFIGGGTPNLISPDGIGALLSNIRARMRVLPHCEVTLEANPGAAQSGQFQALREAGITRLSLGVQTFSAEHLKRLGRIHDPEQALEAATTALEIFDRVNIDLMYGLPDQSLAQALRDVDTALSTGVGHLSLYQLTLEPNTEFARNPPTLPEDELIGDMQDALIAQIQGAGLERYEVSAYARPGERCTHNLNYWTFGDYLGIGAGAHSKLRLPERGTLRQWCLRAPSQYMEAVARGAGSHRQTEAVRDEDLGFEFMMNALRLVEGIEPSRYGEQTGRPLEDLLGGVTRAQALGLMEQREGIWRPTTRGLDLLSDLQILFMHQKKAERPKIVRIQAQ
jgi:oxygen-independent coproporphyrinogen-3 oxidase